MNLDRFSRQTANEIQHSQEYIEFFKELEEENENVCCGCNIEVDITEEVVLFENPIAGQDIVHDLDECLAAYRVKQTKDLLSESKSAVKLMVV